MKNNYYLQIAFILPIEMSHIPLRVAYRNDFGLAQHCRKIRPKIEDYCFHANLQQFPKIANNWPAICATWAVIGSYLYNFNRQ